MDGVAKDCVKLKIIAFVASGMLDGGLSSALAVSYGPAASSEPLADVSVRLRSTKGAISISGFGIKVWEQGRRSRTLTQAYVGYQQLRLQPAAGAELEISGENLRIDLRAAPNRVRLATGAAGRTDIVAIIPFEEYIEGVVATEVPQSWPFAALQAQAVIARSFAMAKVRERSATMRPWLLEAGVADQVFDHARVHAEAKRAVESTRGEYLIRRRAADAAAIETDDEAVAAHYHADCGGQTEEPGAVWGGGPQLGTARDGYCRLNRKTEWRLVRAPKELVAALAAKALVPSGFKLAAVTVAEKSPSGRAQVVELRGESGDIHRVSGQALRESLGYGDLRSTLFKLNRLPSRDFEFVGRGFGHGAGLCQWGARDMARKGADYSAILTHYYPKLVLKRLRQPPASLASASFH